ncbi:MAG: YdcF family protein [Pseudomonadota bacterium]
MAPDILVVLGCRILGNGELSAPAARRVERAAHAHASGAGRVIVLSGGKLWHGRTEASAFAARLVELGIDPARLLLEERSQTTVQNAHWVVALLRERGLLSRAHPPSLGIVTCDWHMARALAAFRRHGLMPEAIPAPSPPLPVTRRVIRSFAESARGVTDAVVARWGRL